MRISLLAILAVGGHTSVCNLVSLVGIEAHHHACSHDHEHDHPHHHGEDGGHLLDLCFESASESHNEEEVPCPETCEVELAETVISEALQAPECPVSDFLLEWTTAPGSWLPEQQIDRLLSAGEPPGPIPLSDRVFTGRFLV